MPPGSTGLSRTTWCVCPTGNVVVDGVLYVYYGGADKYVGVATCRLEELLNYLTEKCRCE